MREGEVQGELVRQPRRRKKRYASGDARAEGRIVRRFWHVRELSTIVILILEIAFFTWYLWPDDGRSHPFLNLENALLILKYSSIYGIAAVGAAVVIISGGIDLAPGSIIALASVICGVLFVDAAWPLGAAMAASLGVGLVAGLLSSMLVVLVGLPPFIATLGIMGITRGAAFIITEGRYFDLSSKLVGGWRPLGLPADWVAPLVMIVLAIVFQILMTRFQWGRAVFSVGGNETAALFSGIAVGRVKTSVYLLSGSLASVRASCWRWSRARGRRTSPPATSSISSRRLWSAARACRADAGR